MKSGKEEARPASTVGFVQGVLALAVSALYVSAATTAAFGVLGKPATGVDDADIFLVYARNFIHGHGIVYSVGGGHVEGFTSILYFLVCSACMLVTAHPERLLLCCNTVFAIATVALVVRLLLRAGQVLAADLYVRLLLVVALLAWVCANPAYFVWTDISLMDGGLYGLLLTASLALCTEIVLQQRATPLSRNLLTGMCCLLVLVRPEGLIWAVVTLLCAMLVSRGFAIRTVQAWRPWAVVAGVLLVLTVWREAYFGYPLPNTYYAKVSSSRAATWHDGFQYLAGFFGTYGAAGVLPLISSAVSVIVFLRGRQSPKGQLALVMAVFTALAYALPLAEGGDHFRCFRMMQPAYPILGLSVLLPVLLIAQLRKLGYALVHVAALALMFSVTDRLTWPAFAANNTPGAPVRDVSLNTLVDFQIASQERVNGARLSDIFTGDLPTVGFGSAGGIALGYQGRVLDMMGLNDVRMAHATSRKEGPKGHQSFDKGTFYKLKPDVLMPRAILRFDPVSLPDVARYYTDRDGWDNLIFKNVFNDPQFSQSYRLALVWSPEHPAFACYGYFNRQYLAGQLAAGRLQIVSAL